MKPKKIGTKWYIEVFAKEFGRILLLDKSGLPVPITFDSEEECLNYMKTLNIPDDILENSI